MGSSFVQPDDSGAQPEPSAIRKPLVFGRQSENCPLLTRDDMAKIDELYSKNFGVEEEPPKFKGTMELPQETAAAL